VLKGTRKGRNVKCYDLSVKDGELRGIVLEKFYEARNQPTNLVNPMTLPGLSSIEPDYNRLFNICEQLSEHGLLNWTSARGLTTVGGMGHISAKGVDVIEGTARSPVTVILSDHRISISHSSNVQIGHSNTITNETGIQLSDLTRLVEEITNHLDELKLDDRQKQRAEAQIATLRTEIAGEPDSAIVVQTLRTLRSITEGAIGSLVAAAIQPNVWHWIQHTLSLPT
jgi:hypothetical protein